MIDSLILPTIDSTNSYMARELSDAPHGFVVAAREQTAGRGQRGNTWESAPRHNLMFSMMLRPQDLPAREAFKVSKAVAVAIARTLESVTGEPILVKWPNDIYTADSRKICGILIENTLSGPNIGRMIVGVGINVNQQRWLSDAPNPVSMYELTGREYPLEPLLEQVCGEMLRLVEADVAAEYRQRLWHGQGEHTFVDAASGECFEASIVDVHPTGHIELVLSDGSHRLYAFKEVIQPIEQSSR